jgi:formylglycine-generating enzyme required for sulfatase activity
MRVVFFYPGNFKMGSPLSEEGRFSGEDVVEVMLSQPFWLANSEVTQAQWEAVMGSNPSLGGVFANKTPFWQGAGMGGS